METQNTQTEIFPGISIEEMRALFFDAHALVEPPFKVYQLNSEGYRYYYRFEDGEPVFYPSVTTMLSQVLPKSPFLIKWMVENGIEGAVEKRDLAAAYGTFMHIQFETLIINGRYDFDTVPVALANYLEVNNLPENVFNEWAVRIRKDVLSFAQWIKDYKVRPLAIEISLVHPEHHYAGCIDLPCVLTDPKTGEEVTAIVDFKSGRKGFWEEHEIQLHLYKMAWDVNFPEYPVQRVYNFSPKDWRTKPTYNFKDQTDSINAQKIPYLLGLAAIEDEKRENTLTIVRGTIDLASDSDLSENVLNLSLAELIKEKHENAQKRPLNAPEESEAINDTGEGDNAVTGQIKEF